MTQDELLRRVVETLERLRLPCLGTGSIATVLYGEPRFTNDIDVVVQLPAEAVEAFSAAFPEDEFCLDTERIHSAIAHRGQFNVIHPASGLKVDVMIPAMDAFDRSRFTRARRVHPAAGLAAGFAAPEDVIVKKAPVLRGGRLGEAPAGHLGRSAHLENRRRSRLRRHLGRAARCPRRLDSDPRRGGGAPR